MLGFGKGQGFTDETGQTLAQGIEPALDVIGLATVLAHCRAIIDTLRLPPVQVLFALHRAEILPILRSITAFSSCAPSSDGLHIRWQFR
jgi:hypothetical protein